MIACIASDKVDLWECPCLECTRLEWEVSDNFEDVSLYRYRQITWPEYYLVTTTRPSGN